MTKHGLIEAFGKNHQELIDYVNSLSAGMSKYSHDGKWTAEQQLSHVYLCLLPFPKVLTSKEFILQKFGKVIRATWNYETVIENYYKTSRKAPERFFPEQLSDVEKEDLRDNFRKIVLAIQQLLEGYSDEELDSLLLPHPLMGNLTIREMFYLMTYHATHHLRQTEKNLESYNA